MVLRLNKILKRSLVVFLCVIFLFGCLSLTHGFRRTVRITAETTLAHMHAEPSEPFPALKTDGLSDLQKRIVVLAAQEYAKKPVSFDVRVITYSDGQKEPWCANFVSWVYKEAGKPLRNPESGSWRIPGVYTMQEYYQQTKNYSKAGHYIPQTGDVAIFTQAGRVHTNIVLAVKGKAMTTIGGNETGHLRLHTQDYSFGAEGLDGFGRNSR